MPRLVALAAFIPVIAVSVDAQSVRRLDNTRITPAFADSVASALVHRHRITGLQVAIVNDGALAYSGAFGLRQKSPDQPMELTSITWTASITKAVFATYVMHLVERDAFPLDSPMVALLRQPLDQYADYRSIAARVIVDPRWGRVTARQMLSHTSGLGNFARFEPDGQMQLHHDPGSTYRYSGEGLNMLQVAIEERYGKPLDVLMDSALFAPHGLVSTSMAFKPRFEPFMADRFSTNGQFLAKTRRNVRAAGSMTANAEDLAKFAALLMDDRIIPRASRRAMLAPQVQIRTIHQFPVPGDSGESAETRRVGLAYGLGWGLLQHTRFGPAFFKEGHGDGAVTYLICFPRRRDCMVMLANDENGEWAFRELLETLFGNTETPWEWEGYTHEYLRRANPQ